MLYGSLSYRKIQWKIVTVKEERIEDRAPCVVAWSLAYVRAGGGCRSGRPKTNTTDK